MAGLERRLRTGSLSLLQPSYNRKKTRMANTSMSLYHILVTISCYISSVDLLIYRKTGSHARLKQVLILYTPITALIVLLHVVTIIDV